MSFTYEGEKQGHSIGIEFWEYYTPKPFLRLGEELLINEIHSIKRESEIKKKKSCGKITSIDCIHIPIE